MHADGPAVAQLSDGFDPSWSPDGARLAVSRASCDYYYCYDLGLAVLDLRSGATVVRELTREADYEPVWSPSGAQIAFLRGSALALITPEGTGLTAVPLPQGTRAASRASWSPDGARLAFGCGADGTYEDICVVGIDGSGFARLTSQGVRNRQPAWSPDGKMIAFVRIDFQASRDSTPTPAVMVMNADGSNVRRLAAGEDPAWSPDGRTIVFRSTALSGLATMAADGTAITRLTWGESDRAPAWRR